MIESETQLEIILNNRVTIGIYPCNQRSRGLSVVCAVLDECAFFRHEGILVDKEIVNSIKPALVTFPNSKLVMVSSPAGKKGVVYEMHRDHYAKETETLIVQGSSDYFNPKISRSFIEGELQKDRSFAMSEYEANFRDDLQDYIDPEALDACISHGIYEIAYRPDKIYHAFADMSGGRRDDSCLSIATKESGYVQQVCLRVKKSPHNPLEAVKEFAQTLKSYGLLEVTGDKYSSGFNKEAWQAEGVRYFDSELSKSDLYLEFLPLVNTGAVSLLDNRDMIIQFRNLERRSGRLKDIVDHSRNLKDDASNAAAGSVVLSRSEYILDFPIWITEV